MTLETVTNKLLLEFQRISGRAKLSIRSEEGVGGRFVINDPAFIPFKKAHKQDHVAQYRTGIRVSPCGDEENLCYIGIYNEFSAALLENFCKNTTDELLIETTGKILSQIDHQGGFLSYSSKFLLEQANSKNASKKSSRKSYTFEKYFGTISEMETALIEAGITGSLIKDVGCKPSSTGMGIKPVLAGTYFDLSFAVNPSNLENAFELLKNIAPLFEKFYPRANPSHRAE